MKKMLQKLLKFLNPRAQAAVAALVFSLGLAACSDNGVRKAAVEAMSAYQVSGSLADVYLKSGLATPATAKVIAEASAAAVKPLDAMGAEIASGSNPTTVEVATALSAIAALQSAITTAQTEAAASSASK